MACPELESVKRNLIVLSIILLKIEMFVQYPEAVLRDWWGFDEPYMLGTG